MGTGRSLSSGRPSAGPVGRCGRRPRSRSSAASHAGNRREIQGGGEKAGETGNEHAQRRHLGARVVAAGKLRAGSIRAGLGPIDTPRRGWATRDGAGRGEEIALSVAAAPKRPSKVTGRRMGTDPLSEAAFTRIGQRRPDARRPVRRCAALRAAASARPRPPRARRRSRRARGRARRRSRAIARQRCRSRPGSAGQR